MSTFSSGTSQVPSSLKNLILVVVYEGTGTNPSYPPVLLEVCFLNTEYLVSVPINYIPLTKIFNPEHIIFVCGPTNPYYRVVTKYLKEINSKLVYEYPTPDKLIINDDRVIWTYHPAYQNRIHKKDEVLIKVRSLVNNE